MQRKPSKSVPIYELKVTLRGISPPIWRRILVPADTTLARLHNVLQVAVGWGNEHLHAFEVDGRQYGPPMPQTGFEVEDERRVRLDQVLKAPQERLIYEYDFGDGWEHDVVLEKVLAPEPGAKYPAVVAGERAAPPEDVGGVYGYAEFLDAIADPEDPEHEELLEWIGGEFAPEAFDMAAVNRELRSVR